MGAGAFHGRVRKGNGCSHPAITTRSAKRNFMFEKLAGVSLFSFEHVFDLFHPRALVAPHTGQRPSRLVARAVRSAIGASGQRSSIIDPDDRFAVAGR